MMISRSIAHERLGAGPPLLLLHPSAFGPDLLRPFAERLAADYSVVLPHRPGYGDSMDLPWPTSLDQHHDDLAAMIDHLHLDHPTIVGLSAGATLALGFARRFPGRAGVVVAHEPLVGPLAPTLHARVTGRIARLLARQDTPHETSLFMSELVGINTWNHLPPACRDAVERNSAVACHEASLFASFALDGDELDELGRSDVVTTVGTRSGEMRQEAAAVLAAHGIERHQIADAGHLPVVDAPIEYARLIRRVTEDRLATPLPGMMP